MARNCWRALALALLATVALPISGGIAEPFEMDSYLTITDGGFGDEASGAKMGSFLAEGTSVSPSGSAPFHRSAVECRFLTYQIAGDDIPYKDRVGAVGTCRINDADDDIFILETQRNMGDQVGNWTLVYGTGKYQGGTGSGTYDFFNVPGTPDSQVPVEWRGDVNM